MRKLTQISWRLAFVLCLLALLGALMMDEAVAQSAGEGQPVIDCDGDAPTITYIGYDFIVSGTDSADVIYVEGGWNFVYANDGDDKICIVGHFNNVYGGDGNDVIIADGLYNQVTGNAGADLLYGDVATNNLDSDGDDLCNNGDC